jgi:wobble nucleotide-excising tRNase
MKEFFKKISIDNGFFGSTVLDIFDKNKERVSVIYGANGTGKTTIGRAFSFIKNPLEFSDFINSSSILDGTGGAIILSEEERQKIYVFNEDFIDKEVSFRSLDKVKSIVMFGKNIENEAKISELNKKIELNKKAILDLKLERYDEKKDSLSHLMYYDQIKKEASQDWAVEEQKILERQTKPPVTDDVMEKILGYDFSKKFDLNEYETKKISFQKIVGKNPQPINDNLAKNFNLNFGFKRILNLLQENYSKPIGSDIVKRISKTLTEKSLNRLQEIKESFNEGYCPYCFRDIDKNYVEHIVDEINKIQSDEIKNHIGKLDESRLDLLNSDFSNYEILDKELTINVTNQIQKLNTYIEELNKKIDIKIDNPYDAIHINSTEVFDLSDLKKQIEKLEELRVNFNQDINDKTKLKGELQKLNLERFSSSIKLLASNYHKQKKEKETAQNQKNKLEKQIETNMADVKKLNAESKNIGIALKMINEYLGLIFLSKSRLYLEESDGSYIVKRGSNSIPLKKLSNGERNAISLCYFFTRMNENQSEESMFNAPSLVVLDDPLSSFDHNNKLGIMHF